MGGMMPWQAPCLADHDYRSILIQREIRAAWRERNRLKK